jgi:hypothetical protein
LDAIERRKFQRRHPVVRARLKIKTPLAAPRHPESPGRGNRKRLGDMAIVASCARGYTLRIAVPLLIDVVVEVLELLVFDAALISHLFLLGR